LVLYIRIRDGIGFKMDKDLASSAVPIDINWPMFRGIL